MSILTRNVTGADVLALRQTVRNRGPIKKDDLVDYYFAGDGSDPQLSDKRKPIEDAIEFLVETEQISESDDGYELTDLAADFDDSRLALLNGIRTREGPNAAYNEVVECLADRRSILANHSGELLDDMRGRSPSQNWNEQKLRYWTRVLDALGIVVEVEGDEATMMVALDRKISIIILRDVTDDDLNALDVVLPEINERYLPVLKSGGQVPQYFQNTLIALDKSADIRLSTVSDIGQSVRIDNTNYNAIEVMTNE